MMDAPKAEPTLARVQEVCERMGIEYPEGLRDGAEGHDYLHFMIDVEEAIDRYTRGAREHAVAGYGYLSAFRAGVSASRAARASLRTLTPDGRLPATPRLPRVWR
jgi:hypothetical protein